MTIVLCIQVLFLLSILLTDKDTLQIVFFLIKCYQTIVLPYKEYIWKNCLTFIQLVSRNRKASKHYSQSITHKAFSLDLCMLETVQLNLVACAQSSLPVFISPQSSSVRSPLTGNAHALGTRLNLTNSCWWRYRNDLVPGAFALKNADHFVNSTSTWQSKTD